MVKVEVVMDEKTLIARHMLNYRLKKLSWALFFIILGGSFILESAGTIDNNQKWIIILAGSGSVLILLNALRIFWHIEISNFSVGLGITGLLLGIARYYSLDVPIWPAMAMIIGIYILLGLTKK
ncbi:MAG: hypothetical protein FIB08_09820 [Candidatus Methanoperedens sp.]|nr:hypothetical protein [Candidatus Methanoperedens sp.]